MPYCASKCPYCDFNSIAGREDEYERYVDALLAEVARLPSGPCATVFLGGGTPTALPPATLARLLAGVRAHLDLAPGYEWTCEANPGSSDAERFAVLAEHGVNRLSIGVQSLDDGRLAALGRGHTAAEAERVVEEARRHFPRVSADLIVGVPGQGPAAATADCALYERHGLDHASVYHLTIEPGTELHARHRRGEFDLDGEEHQRATLEAVRERLAATGLRPYETSNFARPGHECRYNLACWRGRDYHAAGAGAVSTVAGVRATREPHPGRYIAAIAAGGDAIRRREHLDAHDRLVEAWMNGLRLEEGLPLGRLAELGDREARWRPTADDLRARGLIAIDGDRLRLTAEGRMVQDAVTVALMPDRTRPSFPPAPPAMPAGSFPRTV